MKSWLHIRRNKNFAQTRVNRLTRYVLDVAGGSIVFITLQGQRTDENLMKARMILVMYENSY